MEPAKIRDLRYHAWLDRAVEAIRDDRMRDAAKAISEVPPGDLRLRAVGRVARQRRS
jgi:hypothetical protein